MALACGPHDEVVTVGIQDKVVPKFAGQAADDPLAVANYIVLDYQTWAGAAYREGMDLAPAVAGDFGVDVIAAHAQVGCVVKAERGTHADEEVGVRRGFAADQPVRGVLE